MRRAIIYDPVKLSVACGNDEQKEADAPKISGGKSVHDILGRKGLAEVIDTAKGVARHCHSNTLQAKRLTLFEKILNAVEGRKQCSSQRHELGDPQTYDIYDFYFSHLPSNDTGGVSEIIQL